MELKVPYFNLSKHAQEAAFGAIVEILLKSRLKIHLESSPDFYDEDVNTYLAGVLFEYIDPVYQESVRRHWAQRETDVFFNATRTDDAYLAYCVYKINADDRLLDLGIFHPHREEYDIFLEQAKTYYGFASDLSHRLRGRATAVSDILNKLSRWPERYLSILHQARKDYMYFVESLADEELKALRDQAEQDARVQSLKSKQDEFLDAYLAWQKNPTLESKTRLLDLAEVLRKLDPMFRGPDFITHPKK